MTSSSNIGLFGELEPLNESMVGFTFNLVIFNKLGVMEDMTICRFNFQRYPDTLTPFFRQSKSASWASTDCDDENTLNAIERRDIGIQR